jgi:hypothetical protein
MLLWGLIVIFLEKSQLLLWKGQTKIALSWLLSFAEKIVIFLRKAP